MGLRKRLWKRGIFKQTLILLLLCVMLFSQGCCSIFKSDKQTVTIDSQPKGAKVRVGPYQGKTPYDLTLPRGKDYVIQASYEDKQQTQPLNKSIAGLYWVNILFWPGLIIDLATGKMYEYEPKTYNFDFTLED